MTNPILERPATVMLVDDDTALLRTLELALAAEFRQIWSCSDARSARASLAEVRPQLVLLDFSLPDGTAFDLLRIMGQLCPKPIVLAMSGVATCEESFRLAQRGVRGFLQKPFGLEQVSAAVDLACRQAVDLRLFLPATVGQRGVHDVLQEVRETMVDEALARSNGSRRKAAQLLRVSRQLLQYMVRSRRQE